jgi:hypothetical protein
MTSKYKEYMDDVDRRWETNMDGEQVLPEAVTRMMLWRAETPASAHEVRMWLNDNMPFTDDSAVVYYSCADIDEKDGCIIVQYDDYSVTEKDIEAADEFTRSIPCNDVTTIGGETAMSLIRVTTQNKTTLH